MSVNVNFNTLTLVDDGIILGLKNKQKKEILFSELDKIYMKVYKLKLVYELMFIVLPFFLILLAIQYVMLENVMFVALFAVAPVYVKMYGYKRNGLVVCLKDGTVFKKNVPVKLKTENVSMLNAVKRASMEYTVKKRKLEDSELLEVCHPKAS